MKERRGRGIEGVSVGEPNAGSTGVPNETHDRLLAAARERVDAIKAKLSPEETPQVGVWAAHMYPTLQTDSQRLAPHALTWQPHTTHHRHPTARF